MNRDFFNNNELQRTCQLNKGNADALNLVRHFGVLASIRSASFWRFSIDPFRIMSFNSIT